MRILVALLLTISILLPHTTQASSVYYKDIPISHWGIPYVKFIQERNWWKQSGRMLYPDKSITRVEFVELIANTLSIQPINFPDNDNDGLADHIEYKFGSNPLDLDTDKDGYQDIQELIFGYSPTTAHAAPINTSKILFFKDISTAHKHHNLIYTMAEKGMIKGFSDNTFRPTESITRAEMLKLLFKAFRIQTSSTHFSPYKDVPSGHWVGPYLAKSYQEELINTNNLYFRPNQPVSRVEAFKLLVDFYRFTLPMTDDRESQVSM